MIRFASMMYVLNNMFNFILNSVSQYNFIFIYVFIYFFIWKKGQINFCEFHTYCFYRLRYFSPSFFLEIAMMKFLKRL